MSILLLPPRVVLPSMLHVSTLSMVLHLVKTLITRKTLLRIFNLNASRAKAQKLWVDVQKSQPEMSAAIEQTATSLWQRHKMGEISAVELKLRAMGWLSVVHGWEAAVPQKDGDAHENALRKRLMPLEDVSVQVTMALHQSRFDEARRLVRQCPLAAYIDMDERDAQLENCNTFSDFMDALSPISALGSLYLLACFERASMSNKEPGASSICERFVPVEQDGQIVLPMTLFLEHLERTHQVNGKADAVRRFLGGSGAFDNTEYKKYQRWKNGAVFPDRGSFLSVGRTISRENSEFGYDEYSASIVYYALRYLTSLGEIMRTSSDVRYFGGLNGYFRLYGTIYRDIGV